jgi:hypothetical protein
MERGRTLKINAYATIFSNYYYSFGYTLAGNLITREDDDGGGGDDDRG